MSESAAYEETYRGYLARIGTVDLSAACNRLGAEAEADGLAVPLFGEPHRVGPAGVFGPDGRKPHLSVCVILCRYVLLCPSSAPAGGDWSSFKDFRDAAPLVGSFAGTVEGRSRARSPAARMPCSGLQPGSAARPRPARFPTTSQLRSRPCRRSPCSCSSTMRTTSSRLPAACSSSDAPPATSTWNVSPCWGCSWHGDSRVSAEP